MKLPTAVDAHIKNVTRVKLKIDPRAAIGDHPGGIEQLSASMSLSLVVFEENSRGTVELANDNPFGSINHECAVLGHQGNLTKVDFLFLHVFDAAGSGLRVDVPQDQLHRYFQRRSESHPSLVAFLYVVFRLSQSVTHE